MSGFSLSVWGTAYAFAERNGSAHWGARLFARWCCDGGWRDDEHIDAAWDRFRADAIWEVVDASRNHEGSGL